VTTFVQMQNKLLGKLGITQGAGVSALRTKCKGWLNDCAREFWERYEWPGRHSTALFTTFAAYATGTIAVTQGAAVVTLTGGTFPTTITAGVTKFALSYDGPWYFILTRDSGTQITLARNYVETTETAASFVVYQDIYALSTSAESILSHEVVLHRTGHGSIGPIRRAEGEQVWSFPISAGSPGWYEDHDVVSGAKRIRLGPYVPAEAFSVRYGFLTVYVDMSADADECLVPERWRRGLINGALRDGWLDLEEPERAAQAGAAFDAWIDLAWRRYRNETPSQGRMAGLHEAPTRPSLVYPTVTE
jgi:hypothetical protein